MPLRKGLFVSVLVFLLGIVSGCSQERLIFHPEVLPADYRFTFSTPFEEISLPVEGAVLDALLFKTDKKSLGVVLYFHGNAGSLRTWGEIAPEFTSRGYDLFIADFRGFGKSTGRPDNEETLLKDGVAAYAYLAGRYPGKGILVYGRSIGTGIATFVARQTTPRLLILESPFSSLVDLAAHHYPFLPRTFIEHFLRYSFRTDVWIRDTACHVYLFHGTKDDIIPYTASKRLLEILGNRGTLISVEGGGHKDLPDFDFYREMLDTILKSEGRG